MPVHAQALAEAQLFDPQIAARKIEFLAERAACILAAERGAEQVGEVFHGGFGLRRPRTDQARDDIHAVEQEMRAYARLQCVEARALLGVDALAPLLLHVEVAQHRAADQAADHAVAQHEAPLVGGRVDETEIEVAVDREHDPARRRGRGQHQAIRGELGHPRR